MYVCMYVGIVVKIHSCTLCWSPSLSAPDSSCLLFCFVFSTPRPSQCASVWQSLAHLVMLFTASLLHAVALINKKSKLPLPFFFYCCLSLHFLTCFLLLLCWSPFARFRPETKEFGFGLAFQNVILNVFLRLSIVQNIQLLPIST